MSQLPPPTGPALPYPPMPPVAPGQPSKPHRPNAPWGPVLITAAVVSVVGGFVQVTRATDPDLPTATIFGEWFGRALLPALVVGLVARFSSKRWPLWTYVPAVLVPMLLLALLVAGQDAARSARALGDENRIVAPAGFAGLERLSGPRVRTLLAQAAEEFEQTVGDEDDLVTAAYGVPGKGPAGSRVVLIGVNLAHDGEFADEARRSPEGTVREVLKGAQAVGSRSFDTEGRDGLMSCASIPRADDMVICTWLAAGRLGMVLHVTERDLAKAAATTRALRAAAETPS